MKQADGGPAVERRRGEAEILGLARHPGVVELVGLDTADDGESACLRTVRVDGSDLAEVYDLTPEEIAGVTAAVASTLADLHEIGLVHGAVAPEHVILDGRGRPVLCGLADGGRIDALHRPEADVHALGGLIGTLVAGSSGPAAAALADIATLAAAPDPTARPTAREVAALLHDRIPAAVLPGRVCAQESDAPSLGQLLGRVEPQRRRRRLRISVPRLRLRVVAPVALVAIVIAGALAFRPRPSPAPAPPPTHDEPVAAVPGPPPAPPTSLPAQVWPPPNPSCPPVDGPLRADVDGDGCEEVVSFDAGVVAAGRSRWQVGAPGDAIATADWTCTGTVTLALVRPATGDVFVLPGWAEEGHDLEAKKVGTVPGGRAISAADRDGDGCIDLVVNRASGPSVTLPVKGTP